MKHEPPPVRQSLTMESVVGDMKFWVTLAFYDHDPLAPCDCFWNIAKEGSTIGGVAQAIALTAAMSFQHGVPWPEIKKHLSHPNTMGLTEAFVSVVDQILAERAKQLGYTQEPHNASADTQG